MPLPIKRSKKVYLQRRRYHRLLRSQFTQERHLKDGRQPEKASAERLDDLPQGDPVARIHNSLKKEASEHL